MHIAEIRTVAKSLPPLRWNTHKSLILSYSADFSVILDEKLYSSMGIHTTIKEKTIRTQFEDFIDCRTIDYGDIIEEFTFKYVNTLVSG